VARGLTGSVPLVRAIQVTSLDGPDAVAVTDVPEPDAGAGVLIDVRAAGVSFPDVLQARGQYQAAAEPPYVPGVEAAGIVRAAPAGSPFAPGDRVAAMTQGGGWAEVAVAASELTFALPDALDFAQGAGLVLNYHTAYFALVLRGRLRTGETVLVHGAAGGVGTATLQVARGLGARTIAVVSSAEKERVARAAGADEVVRSDGPWRDDVRELTGGGADVVLDPVGGDRFTDSLRALRDGGRLLVVGFTGGSIPEVRVNRLLLRNLEVIGAGWGAWTNAHPDDGRDIGVQVHRLADTGVVRPIVGARFALEDAAEAMRLVEGRGALGKVVLVSA
jgi:NADPH2:quinone reductase